MKILIISTVHPEDDVRVYYKEAFYLSKTNEVTLVTQRYTNMVFNEVNYIPLKRVKNRLSRILLQKEVYRIIRRQNPDIIHFHDPELILLALLCKKQGYKVVWDVHEDLPKQIVKKHWIKPKLRPLASATAHLLERVSVGHLNLIVAATPSIADKFTNRDIVVVKNYPILSEFKSLSKVPRGIPSFVYVGGISKERGFEEAIAAIKLVSKEHEVRFDLAGKFVTEQLREKLPVDSDTIVFHGWLNREGVSSLLSNSLAGLVALHPSPNHIESLPIKMFEYMASGKAIIASDFPLWREIVEKYECGLLVDPLDPESISNAMIYLIKNPDEATKMGERGRKAIEQELNWENEFLKLNRAYDRLLEGENQ